MRPSDGGRLVGLGGFGVAGLAAGALAKIADESGVGWLADLGTYPAVWVLALATVGRAAPAAGASALRAAVFFTAVVAGYYGWARMALGFPWGYEPLYWLAIAALAVPLTATGIWWASRDTGPVAGLVIAAIAAIAVSNGAMLRVVRVVTGDLPFELVRPVQAVFEIGVSTLLLVVFPADHRTRWWAIGTWLPLVWLAPRILDTVLARIGVG